MNDSEQGVRLRTSVRYRYKPSVQSANVCLKVAEKVISNVDLRGDEIAL